MKRSAEEAILDAALQVFSDKGFHRATNRDVAEAAGIASPGLIYHYFKNKHDLLRAVMMRQVSVSVVGPDAKWPTLPLQQALLELALSFLKLIADPDYQRLARIAIHEAITNREFAQSVFAMGPAKVFAALGAVLSKAIDEGDLGDYDPAVLTHLFLGPLIKAMLQRIIFGFEDGQDPQEAARIHVEIFLHGCRR
jgi:AcrR family transcriptional regulator